MTREFTQELMEKFKFEVFTSSKPLKEDFFESKENAALRFFDLYAKLNNLSQKCLITLKMELHMRCFDNLLKKHKEMRYLINLKLQIYFAC